MKRVLFLFLVLIALVRAETLNITVSGNGQVISTPAGINCSANSTCSATFATNTNVVLQAIPYQGNVFWQWDNNCPCAGNPCTLIMNANRNCIAIFIPIIVAPPVGGPPVENPQVSPAYRQSIACRTGTVILETTQQNTAQPSCSDPPFTPPEGFSATYGQLSFSITASSGFATVRLIFPKPIPAGSRVYKVVGSNVYDITNRVDIRGSTISYLIYDNSELDADSTPGVIQDPVVLLENQSPPQGGGGGGCSAGGPAGFLGYLALVVFLILRRLL